MVRKSIRFSSVAIFLAVILTTMLLSRFEEKRQAVATEAAENEQAVPVLMYHHLLRRAENTRYVGNDIVTLVEDFEQQLAWLREQGFESISPQQLSDWYFDGGSLPDKPVMITFDDGYMSNYVYAYPLLKQYGFTAVIFSVTEKISAQEVTFHPNNIEMLDERSMQEGGDVFFYASHTNDLHKLNNHRSALVTAGAAAVQRDLEESLKALRQYPSCCDFLFSYPYGQYSKEVETVLRENGVRLAFRAHKGRLTRSSDPFSLPRYPVSYAVSFKTFQSYFSEYT